MKPGVNRSKLETNASQDLFLGIRPLLNNLAAFMYSLMGKHLGRFARIVQRE
jgi:hypothetical protein